MKNQVIFSLLLLGFIVGSASSNQYGDKDADRDSYGKHQGSNYGGGNSGYGADYGNAAEERPRIKLNLGFHVPAMKIQLPKMNMPKITIRAKVRQPYRPMTMYVPEIQLDSSSKLPGPAGSQPASGNGYDSSSDDSYRSDNSQSSYGSSGNSYGSGSSSSYGSSSSEYVPSKGNYQSRGTQPSVGYAGAATPSSHQPLEPGQTLLTATNDNHDGVTQLSMASHPGNSNEKSSYGSSNSGYQRPSPPSYQQQASSYSSPSSSYRNSESANGAQQYNPSVQQSYSLNAPTYDESSAAQYGVAAPSSYGAGRVQSYGANRAQYEPAKPQQAHGYNIRPNYAPSQQQSGPYEANNKRYATAASSGGYPAAISSVEYSDRSTAGEYSPAEQKPMNNVPQNLMMHKSAPQSSGSYGIAPQVAPVRYSDASGGSDDTSPLLLDLSQYKVEHMPASSFSPHFEGYSATIMGHAPTQQNYGSQQQYRRN